MFVQLDLIEILALIHMLDKQLAKMDRVPVGHLNKVCTFSFA